MKPNAKSQSIEAELRAILAESCGRDVSSIDADADLVRQLGLDSLALLRLLAEIEMRLGVRFPDAELGRLRSLRQFIEALPEAPEGRTS